MFTILTHPADALLEAKKEHQLGKALMELVAAALLFAVATYLVGSQLVGPFAGVPSVANAVGGSIVVLAVAAFMGVLVFGLIAGYLALQIFQTLGGTGDFTSGVTPISYSLFLGSIGIILAVVFNYIPYGIGSFLGALILLYFLGLAMATVFRGYKELFEIDYITAFIGLTVLWGAFTLTAFFAVMLGLSPFVASLAPAFGQLLGNAVTGGLVG